MPRRLRIGWPRHYTAVVTPGAYDLAGQSATLTYTPASDTTPNAFTFVDQTGVALSTAVTSAAITIAGLSTGVTITLNASGGTIDKNGDANFLGSQLVGNGDTVRARVTSSASNSTATNCTVVASPSGVQDVFTATTTSGGTVSDGDIITRTGPAATKPSMIEWLGGLGGVIASGANGSDFSRANWSKSFTNISRWTHTNGRSLSRSVSLLADNKFPTPTDGRKTWYYDYSSTVKSEYRSVNYFVDIGVASTVQWKRGRLTYAGGDENDGQDPSWYNTSWHGGSNSSLLIVFNQESLFPQRDWVTWSWGEWVRCETWFTSNTPDGTANGRWRTRWTRISDGSVLYDTGADSRFTGLLFRGVGVPAYQRAVWQNYLGNEAPTDTQLRVYMDDIYMSASSATTGAFVRAEVWDASSSPTKRAICEIQSISGTDWSVRINKSYLTTLTGAYLVMFNDTDTDASATKVAL